MSLADPEVSTVLVATDSFLIGDGLTALLADVPDIEVVGRARNHAELLVLAEELRPDIAIISIRNPILSTTETVAAARPRQTPRHRL